MSEKSAFGASFTLLC